MTDADFAAAARLIEDVSRGLLAASAALRAHDIPVARGLLGGAHKAIERVFALLPRVEDDAPAPDPCGHPAEATRVMRASNCGALVWRCGDCGVTGIAPGRGA